MSFVSKRAWWFTLSIFFFGLTACASPTPISLAPTAAPIATPITIPTQPRAATDAATDVSSPTPALPAPTPSAAATSEAPTATVAATEIPAPALAPPPADFFGVNTNGEILHNEQARALAVVGGVRMVRVAIDWRGIERTQGKYNWGNADAVVKPLLENNFAPYIMIFTNPDWAATTECGPVNDLLAFDQFLRALVARYPRVKYWGLYNEPDNVNSTGDGAGCFGAGDLNNNGKSDVEDYAEQLHVAWRAIHQTNPNAQLITGAFAFDNFDRATAPSNYPGRGEGGSFNYHFLQQLFQYIAAHPLPDGEKYFDVLAFNFYNIYGPYWERQVGGINVGAKAGMIRKLMQDAGVSYPLMLSETGSNSQSSGNQGQSDNLAKIYTRARASDLRHAVWWTYQDFPDSSAPPVNTFKYGIIDEKGTPKPAYAAFQTNVRMLEEASFVQPLNVPGGEGYLFNKGKSGIAVLWSASDAPINVSFAGKTLQVTDVFGAVTARLDGSSEDQDSAAERIGVAVGPSPVYVELVGQ